MQGAEKTRWGVGWDLGGAWSYSPPHSGNIAHCIFLIFALRTVKFVTRIPHAKSFTNCCPSALHFGYFGPSNWVGPPRGECPIPIKWIPHPRALNLWVTLGLSLQWSQRPLTYLESTQSPVTPQMVRNRCIAGSLSLLHVTITALLWDKSNNCL